MLAGLAGSLVGVSASAAPSGEPASASQAAAGAQPAPSPALGAPREVRKIIVVGAGVFGAWTAWNLLQRGHSVWLLDAWGPSHARASSGGETRLIRTEYGGDPIYTRWAWDSLAEWHLLSKRHDNPIFHQVGALYMYPREIEEIDKSMAVQRALGIPIDKLGAVEMRKRWPQIDFTGIELVCFSLPWAR